jgi:hypothetical protein
VARRRSAEYESTVFINCPFDSAYQPVFDAIVFAVMLCGLRPSTARERRNSAEVRLDKILSLIRDARFGIHDLSRTAPDADSGLPRFNMPFELGVDFGCRNFNRAYSDKSFLIFAERRYDYQKFLSDISGHDIAEHQNEPGRAIREVRDFLGTETNRILPGGEAIARAYDSFRNELPEILEKLRVIPNELTFVDLTLVIRDWLTFRSENITP